MHLPLGSPVPNHPFPSNGALQHHHHDRTKRLIHGKTIAALNEDSAIGACMWWWSPWAKYKFSGSIVPATVITFAKTVPWAVGAAERAGAAECIDSLQQKQRKEHSQTVAAAEDNCEDNKASNCVHENGPGWTRDSRFLSLSRASWKSLSWLTEYQKNTFCFFWLRMQLFL